LIHDIYLALSYWIGIFKKSNTLHHIFEDIHNRIPFLLEIIRFFSTMATYKLAGGLCYLLWGLDSTQARGNALTIIAIEKLLGINIEQELQIFAYINPFIMNIAIRLYKHSQIPITLLCVSIFFSLDRELYYYVINPWTVVNCIAFFVFTLYPCTPPRLIPHLNIADSMHTPPFGIVNQWQDNRFANQHAAMPSMHCAWSLFIGVGLSILFSKRVVTQMHSLGPLTDIELFKLYGPLRKDTILVWTLCMLYPISIAMSTIITGNHYILDIFFWVYCCHYSLYYNT